MKTLLLGSVALIALTSAASAADLAPKTYIKTLAQPAIGWTGFYLSGGAGYGQWEADEQIDNFFGTRTAVTHIRGGGHGYFGTVGGGYDWRFNPSWVVGVFADASFGNIEGSYNIGRSHLQASAKNTISYAAGARLGYLIAPNALTYVSAGYSHADFAGGAFVADNGPTGSDLPNIRADGWFIGGGIENSLDIFSVSAPGWFMKSEYRLAGYGRADFAVTNGTLAGLTGTFKPYVQTVSTALVYRFNSDLPPATAARVPIYVKAPKAAANWTGFYLSGGGGYGLLANDTIVDGSNPSRVGGRGWFGTVGGGYDWQFAPSWIAGVFADAQFGDIKSSLNFGGPYPASPNNNLNYAAGIRAGYLVAPNVLSYVSGGYSHADLTASRFTNPVLEPLNVSATKTHFDGWFLGGGVENSLDSFGLGLPGWFMKTEYRVAEYDRKGLTIPIDGGPVLTPSPITAKPYIQTVSTSLVYRFDSGALLSAKN